MTALFESGKATEFFFFSCVSTMLIIHYSTFHLSLKISFLSQPKSSFTNILKYKEKEKSGKKKPSKKDGKKAVQEEEKKSDDDVPLDFANMTLKERKRHEALEQLNKDEIVVTYESKAKKLHRNARDINVSGVSVGKSSRCHKNNFIDH